MTLNISILGTGSWGSALAHAFSSVCDEVLIYGRTPRKYEGNVKYTSDLKHALKNEIIFLAVPAKAMREVISDFSSKITGHKLIICAKGIENETLKFMSEIVNELIPDNEVFVLSGPNFASEIIESLPAASIIAGGSAYLLAKKLSSKNFVLVPSEDIIGVQIAGAIKNIIAIACGISIGLNLGENIKAAIITGGISEMGILIDFYKGKRETLMGLAGIGDLTLTCNSKKSRNLQFGIDSLHNVKDDSATIEGKYSCISIHSLMNKHKLNLPICRFVYDYLYNNKDPKEISGIIHEL